MSTECASEEICLIVCYIYKGLVHIVQVFPKQLLLCNPFGSSCKVENMNDSKFKWPAPWKLASLVMTQTQNGGYESG